MGSNVPCAPRDGHEITTLALCRSCRANERNHWYINVIGALERVRELGDASVPFAFDVHAMIPSQDAPALEHALHKRFVRAQMNKVNPRKELFRIALRELREEIERMGYQPSWTTTAECREFRETQAIELKMASNTFDEQAWLRDQAIKEKEIVQGEEEAVEATA